MLTRRRFLIDGLRISALMPVLPELSFARSRADETGERVLVVVQLSGGNDGLNTVIPHAQDAYYRLRPNLAHAQAALSRLDDAHGLHPAARMLHDVYEPGHLAILQGVGHGHPDRSHFRSLEIWHGADPSGPAADTGWLGRLADQIALQSSGALPAIALGGANLPLSMRGERLQAPTVRDVDGFRESGASAQLAPWRDQLLEHEGAGDLAFLRQAARGAYDAAARIQALAAHDSPVDYPGGGLARGLALVAQLVASRFGTRIFHLELGGFDTHARQGPVHAALLAELGGALRAFQQDLFATDSAARVVTFVFSEFGRRARENGSKGTDHGRGAPVFLMGEPVRGGLHGTPADLEHLVDGDVPATTDFRAVYTTLERDWMGLTPSTGGADVSELLLA